MASPLTYTPRVAIRHPAPDFTVDAVVDGDFQTVSLSQYRGKYVVLFFYPLDFTFVCPTEIVQFSEMADQFAAINCQVIGASVDSKFSHLQWINTPRKLGGLGGMKIPLIADLTKQISKDYGVLIDHGGDNGVALRGTFIIDDKGIVRHIGVNDLPVGRNPEETLRLVKAFQFTDVHGEVCPAKWTPGAPTMVADVGSEKTKQYWADQHSKVGSQ
eukprot:GILK01000391.1.p1 GENE.GILK01000391.1~~GILK01000391.1.p1  ORF type:complete len:230 (-),score=24.65 GILK01000391.1:69-713(-)